MTKTEEKREIKQTNRKSKKNKLHIPDITATAAVKILISLVSGFFFSNPFVLGFSAPFACSLTATLDGIYSYAACLGSCIGAIVFSDSTAAAKYIAVPPVCLLLIALGRRYLNKKLRPAINCATAFLSPLAVGFTVIIATGFLAEELLMCVCESVLSAVGAYIFSKCAKVLATSSLPLRLSYGEKTCIFLAVANFLMCFYGFEILHFSPVAILLCAVILLSARLGDNYDALLSGVCVGVSVGLSGRFSFICIAYAISGLAAGILSKKGKLYTAAGFIAVIALSSIIDGCLDAYMTVPAVLVAAVIFAAIPDKLFVTLQKKLGAPLPYTAENIDRKQLSQKLNDASEAIGKVSECVGAVRETLGKADADILNSELLTCRKTVCDKCDMRASCRDSVKNATRPVIDRLAYALKTRGELDESDFPKNFSSDCYLFAVMKRELENQYCAYLAELGAKGKANQLRELMSDQFRCVSDILGGIAEDFDRCGELNSQLAIRCSEVATEFGLTVTESSVFSDCDDKCCLKLTILPPKENFNVTALTKLLSQSANTVFDLPELEKNDNDCVLKFTPKASFCVEIGAYSRSADDRQICGDYYRSFSTEDGKYIAVLSDGMGTGSRAAVDSAMAAELFAKLIKSGLGFGCSLSVTNSAMLVKSEDESLATLDIIKIDLCSGKCEFMKSGAAASFILRGDEVSVIESSSLPIGILRDVSFAETSVKLQRGDLVLMVSDGVVSDGYNKIQQDLKLYASSSPAEIAEIIVNNACLRRPAKQRDDMTALVLLIK